LGVPGGWVLGGLRYVFEDDLVAEPFEWFDGPVPGSFGGVLACWGGPDFAVQLAG
jgi:hypothetical protein